MITFHQLIPNPRPPIRATKNAGGHLPDRHHRCEPVRLASGLGWYVFLPLDFQIIFDGVESIISLDDGTTWFPLTSIQYPHFADTFDHHAPPEVKGCSNPFVAMTEDHAILQIWTGYVVKTDPDYSLLLRAPANFIAGQGYQHFEGVVETDRWFGPLFTNVKLLRTDAPIHFHAHNPFLQLTPLHRPDYDDRRLNDFTVKDGFDPEFDWSAYHRTIRKPALYAAETRKRRAQEKGGALG